MWRSKLTYFFASKNAGLDTIGDLEIVNTCAPSAFSKSNGLPIHRLEYAETAKIAKHGKNCANAHCKFVPFVLDRFGSLGSHAQSFFNSLVNEVLPDVYFSPNWAASCPSSFWRQRLSVALWCGVSHESFYLYHRCVMANVVS